MQAYTCTLLHLAQDLHAFNRMQIVGGLMAERTLLCVCSRHTY